MKETRQVSKGRQVAEVSFIGEEDQTGKSTEAHHCRRHEVLPLLRRRHAHVAQLHLRPLRIHDVREGLPVLLLQHALVTAVGHLLGLQRVVEKFRARREASSDWPTHLVQPCHRPVLVWFVHCGLDKAARGRHVDDQVAALHELGNGPLEVRPTTFQVTL